MSPAGSRSVGRGGPQAHEHGAGEAQGEQSLHHLSRQLRPMRPVIPEMEESRSAAADAVRRRPGPGRPLDDHHDRRHEHAAEQLAAQRLTEDERGQADGHDRLQDRQDRRDRGPTRARPAKNSTMAPTLPTKDTPTSQTQPIGAKSSCGPPCGTVATRRSSPRRSTPRPSGQCGEIPREPVAGEDVDRVDQRRREPQQRADPVEPPLAAPTSPADTAERRPSAATRRVDSVRGRARPRPIITMIG